jgi:hypothetical protein
MLTSAAPLFNLEQKSCVTIGPDLFHVEHEHRGQIGENSTGRRVFHVKQVASPTQLC